MESALSSRYLRLLHNQVISTHILAKLLCKFGSLAAICDIEDKQLLTYGLTDEQIGGLRRPQKLAASVALEAEQRWSEVHGNAIICFEDSLYPALLREIAVPPPLLYVRGNAQLLNYRQFAIVGSRKPGSYGLRNAYWMAYELSQAGLLISSGLARGIDSRAHQGALAAGANTLAVVGTGVDVVYPRSNQKLADQIAERGVLVSEFSLGTLPLPLNFPRRNRIISGLSLGTLVVEATLKSGSLITARLALEQNRDVFAIPGLISDPLAAGCHQLLNSGARLVQSPADILEDLGIENRAATTAVQKQEGMNAKARPMETTLLQQMGNQGCELQVLLDVSGLDHQLLIKTLLQFELAGKIRVAGGRYFRTN